MKDRIRILHVMHSFSAGGLENGVVNIINGSPDHLEHELCFLASGGEFLKRLERPVPFYEIQKREGNDIGALWRLGAIIRRGDYDIVHTRNWAAFDGVIASLSAPRVAVVHGEHGRDISDPLGLNQRRNFFRRVAGFRIKKFVVVSRDLGHWLHTVVGVPMAKICVIYNGVDTAWFQQQRDSSLRSSLGIKPDEFVVGTVARLDPVKNHEGLIRAVRLLNDAGRTVRLVIVGDGPHREKLVETIGNWQKGPEPILAGFSSDPAGYYAVFDIFVQNSFAEGMSNTMLEAMSCGLPVVCTPVGGNIELIDNETRGRYVPVSDDAALAETIAGYQDSPRQRIRHGENCMKFVRSEFALPKMVDKYVRLYESAR